MSKKAMVPVDEQEARVQETITGKHALQQLLNRMMCIETEFAILMENLGIFGLKGNPELTQSRYQTSFFKERLKLGFSGWEAGSSALSHLGRLWGSIKHYLRTTVVAQ